MGECRIRLWKEVHNHTATTPPASNRFSIFAWLNSANSGLTGLQVVVLGVFWIVFWHTLLMVRSAILELGGLSALGMNLLRIFKVSCFGCPTLLSLFLFFLLAGLCLQLSACHCHIHDSGGNANNDVAIDSSGDANNVRHCHLYGYVYCGER